MRKFLALLLACLTACPVYGAGLLKNVAGQKIGAQLVSATDGSAFTGSVTVSVTGDAGTQATGATGSGSCTHEGGGYHTYTPDITETNYELIAFTFSGTGAVPVTVQVFTDPGEVATQASVDEIIATLGTPVGPDLSADIAGVTLTANDMAAAVWGAVRATYTTAGTFGEYTPANVTHWLGSAAATPTTAGVPEVDVTHWIGTAAATPTTAGVPEVDVTYFGGTLGTFASGRPEVNASHLAGTAYAPAIATVVDNIWDEALSGHATAGSAGAGLSAAQSAGDPWSTAIPGAYTAGTAGFIVGTNLDAAVSSAGGGSFQPRINRKPDPAFTVRVSRRADGTHKAPTPIRITPGAIDGVFVFIDLTPLFGPDNYVQTVGTPTVESGGSITASAEGPRDTYAVVELDGTATANEERTITVPVTMDTGTTVNVVFDVIVFAE